MFASRNPPINREGQKECMWNHLNKCIAINYTIVDIQSVTVEYGVPYLSIGGFGWRGHFQCHMLYTYIVSKRKIWLVCLSSDS